MKMWNLTMKRIFKTGALCITLVIFVLPGLTQEYVMPLKNNPHLLKNEQLPVKKKTNEGLIELPVTDDFS